MKPIRFLLLCLFTLASNPVAWAMKPLLIPGKQALYQRVLIMPEGRLYTAVGQPSGQQVTPFTAYYVYARQQHHQDEWLQVSTSRHGDIAGWLRAEDTLEWRQGLTVAFREPINHDRALLFNDPDALQAIAQQRDLRHYAKLHQAAIQGERPGDSPVVAIQPAGKLDIREHFYLVPIRQHRDIYLGSARARMLQIASVPLNNQPAQPSGTTAAPATESLQPTEAPPVQTTDQATAANQDAYRAGLVFAIDATLSMQPYIDRTQQAVMKIYDSLGDAGLLGNVNFGLVAFRDSVQAAPDLEFLTRTFVNLEQGRNPGAFLQQINTLKAADASSQDFTEDAYAGVKQAIDDMDWNGHAARYVVLVTDAGPREGADPLSSTGLSAATLRALAQKNNIAIFVMHLLTPNSMANFTQDAAKYQELSDFPGVGSLYYGVPTGDVKEFGLVLDTLAQQITRQVWNLVNQQQSIETITHQAPPRPPEPVREASQSTPQLVELTSKVEKLGHALRMRYLQKDQDDKLPRLFNAWLLDRDIRNPDQRTLDVQVLLTRDQLSDLHDILRQVLQTAEDGLLSPRNFLNELKSLAATIARDPGQLGNTTAITAGQGNSLADLGFMREYIEDLPYTGEVMNLSLDDWENWSARRQIDFLHRLEEKIDYYRALHDHTDLWVSLDNGPIDGDSVFPLTLEMLP